MNQLPFYLLIKSLARIYIIFTCLSLFASSFVYAQSQTPTCNCPPNMSSPIAKKADTVFHLSNGRSIALCGGKDTLEGKAFYSEFVIAACGQNHIIKFWDAVQLCQLRVIKDTLFVEEMEELPIGKDMQDTWSVWTIERIYFKNGKAIKDFNVNRNIRGYNKQEIQAALNQYEQADKSSRNVNVVNNVNMEIADKLFISAMSGSGKARTYLKTFDKHFGGLSGESLEWYDDLMRKLKEWDTNKSSDGNY